MDLSVQEQDELKAQLEASNEEFRAISAEHAALKARVTEIEANPHPSDAEVEEEARLKRRKLQLKDRMLELMHQHRELQPA
jgi:uncharacterized protein YdcH (DUF465 family)